MWRPHHVHSARKRRETIVFTQLGRGGDVVDMGRGCGGLQPNVLVRMKVFSLYFHCILPSSRCTVPRLANHEHWRSKWTQPQPSPNVLLTSGFISICIRDVLKPPELVGDTPKVIRGVAAGGSIWTSYLAPAASPGCTGSDANRPVWTVCGQPCGCGRHNSWITKNNNSS